MSKFTTGHCQVTPDPEIQALRNHALADQAKKRPLWAAENQKKSDTIPAPC